MDEVRRSEVGISLMISLGNLNISAKLIKITTKQGHPAREAQSDHTAIEAVFGAS